MLPLLICGDLIAPVSATQTCQPYARETIAPGDDRRRGDRWVVSLVCPQPSRVGRAALINLDIGFESVLLVGLHWYRQFQREREDVYVPKPWHNHFTGTFAGISSTLALAAGPIIAPYLLLQRPTRQTFVGIARSTFSC